MPVVGAESASRSASSPMKNKQQPVAKPPSPIKIAAVAPKRSEEPKSSVGRPQRRSDLVASLASIVLVALVAIELATTNNATEDFHEWSCWIVTLVFPSQQVTWIKIVCLVVGFLLTTSYFLSTQAQLASAEQMMIHSATALASPLKRKQPKSGDQQSSTPSGKTSASWLASHYQSLLRTDHFASGGSGSDDGGVEIPQLQVRDECKPETPVPLSACSEFDAVNGKQPTPFESEYLQGHYLFLVKDSSSTDATDPAAKKPSHWAPLFGNKRRMMWVQVQARFKKLPPPRTALYLATELPTADGFQVAFLTRQLVSLLITLVKKFVPTAHVAFGDSTSTTGGAGDHELPHAAFPLYQTVDEFVMTDPSVTNSTLPLLGRECFGESIEAKKTRAATPVGMEPTLRIDAVYSFQFHTMYADLAQWKIVNVPGMPDMALTRFCGKQPIRVAAYAVDTPSHEPSVLCNLSHKNKDKKYLFCLSMHHNASLMEQKNTTSSSASCATTLTTSPPQQQQTLVCPKESTCALRLPSSPQRWRSVSCDQPQPVVRQQTRQAAESQAMPPQSQQQQKQQNHQQQDPTEASSSLAPSLPCSRPQPRIRASSSVRNMSSLERAEDLSNWSFSLPVWIERVDPVVGNRKVAYLFVIQEKPRPSLSTTSSINTSSSTESYKRRRCVVRTATTVKSTLLLLDASEENMGEHAKEFKKLIVEAREFLYETICRETTQVARALQGIADKPSDQATELDKEKQAMLFNCLMSEAQLPCIRSYHDLGVRLTKAKRDQMDIIFEKGIYRMLDPRFLRQEWFTLTTTELQFFRSFTLKASKSIPLAHVLGIQSVDDVPFLEDSTSSSSNTTDTRGKPPIDSEPDPRQLVRDAAARCSNRWFGVEIHVLSEVVTLFLDTASDRTQFISSLNQLIKLKSANSSAGVSMTRLPPPRSIEATSGPLCCNQRRRLPMQCSRSTLSDGGGCFHGKDLKSLSAVELAEEMVTRGLRLYGHPREDIQAADVVSFLDAVECLNELRFDNQCSPPTDETFSSDDLRLAFALNLFHALYIHTWLLFGEISTHAQWKKIKSIPCYSIGNHANAPCRLTLQDIESWILQVPRAKPNEDTSTSRTIPLPFLCLVPSRRDLRSSFVLETNSGKLTGSLLRVYHVATLHQELNETCAAFLEKELTIEDVERVIHLPKLCEWNASDYALDTSATAVPIAAAGSRAFLCLQALLPLLNAEQHDRVQHLLLGAGKECQIKYSARFWTHEMSHQVAVAKKSTQEEESKSPPSSTISAIAKSSSTANLIKLLTGDSTCDAAASGTSSATQQAAKEVGCTTIRDTSTSNRALQFFQSFFLSEK